MDSLDSDSRPSLGFWDWATDLANFSLETLRKENLGPCDAQSSQCLGQMLRSPWRTRLCGRKAGIPQEAKIQTELLGLLTCSCRENFEEN